MGLYQTTTVIGAVLGVLSCILFGSFAETGKDFFATKWLGMEIGEVISAVFVGFLVMCFVFFVYVGLAVRDIKFPSKHPWLFILETLAAGLIPATFVYVFEAFRSDSPFEFFSKGFLIFAAKCAMFNLYFQFSGFYGYLMQ